MKVDNYEVIDTTDGKTWMYSKENGWIEVTMPEKLKDCKPLQKLR